MKRQVNLIHQQAISLSWIVIYSWSDAYETFDEK